VEHIIFLSIFQQFYQQYTLSIVYGFVSGAGDLANPSIAEEFGPVNRKQGQPSAGWVHVLKR
jgi:hypothetical protein